MGGDQLMPRAKKIILHTSNTRLARLIHEQFDSKVVRVEVELDVALMPRKADLVLSTTPSSSTTEWTAARLGCYVAIVPEAMDYIAQLLDRADGLVLVGADRGR